MKYSFGFGKKSSKILLGTAYFGDTISEEVAFEIMDAFVEMGGHTYRYRKALRRRRVGKSYCKVV